MFWIGVLGIVFGLSSSALAEDLQPTKLYCGIREGRFITYLAFRNEGELVGEVANYQVLASGAKQYLSGLLFTHISFNNDQIIGDTGDPSDLIGRLTFTRLESAFAGHWGYNFQRSETEVVRATFQCLYSDTPPPGWRDLFPRRPKRRP